MAVSKSSLLNTSASASAASNSYYTINEYEDTYIVVAGCRRVAYSHHQRVRQRCRQIK
jgi:hypothetical protein